MRTLTRPSDARTEDRGAVTVLAVALLGMLLLLAAAFGVAESMVTAHRRAQSAADLAALAGAQALQDAADGCMAASANTHANGAVLDACTVAGQELIVTAHVTGPRWLGAHGNLSARARAGPAR